MQDVTERKIIEEALRASQQLLKRTFDSLSEAVLVLDADTTEIMDCNPAAETVFGYSRHEMLGQKISMLHVDEATYEEFRENLYPAIEEKGRLDQFEFRMKRRDGTVFPTEHSVTPLKNEQGTQVGWVSVIHDITERKRAREALVGSEREKSAILNGMEDLVVYYDSPDMNIIWANRAAAESVNLSVDELIGEHCCKIWHQQNKPLDSCPVVRAFETGQPEEEETTTPDGRIWFVRGWPVKDDEGKTIGVVKVSRNSTETKRAEEALRESEEWFRAIYEESPIAINVFDHDGNLIHANPACVNLAGVSSVEDLKGFNIFEDPNFPEDKKQQLLNGERVLLSSTIDWSKVKDARLYDTSKTGVCYVETGASPLRYGEDEALHGYMIQMVDITERVLAEANTKAAAETAMLYLDLMGHDIRNHLQAIIMGTEILERLDIRPEVREMIDIVTSSVENSRNLIKKVQATRGLLSVPLSRTPLREALEDCLQVLNEKYDDVQIEVNLGSQRPTVFADKYLGNLLMNILENAILHNDKKTRRVWLDLREATEGYEVVIADNGLGIGNDMKESLFDQSRRFGGVGVHQAFKITQKYGGHISVQDRVPGDSSNGAEFHIWFPKSTP
jgi:PAS domain S-box-containing protein